MQDYINQQKTKEQYDLKQLKKHTKMQVAAALEMSIQTQKRDLLALNKAHNEQIKQFSKLTSENHRDENPQFQKRIMLPTQTSQIEAQNEFIQPIDIKDDDLPISDYISDFSDSK